eukprot:COSAG05_NODE_320_length_11481_cov_32.028730_2_plen_361_part_00
MSSTRAGGIGVNPQGKDGRMEKVSVHRHWAGKRPEWAAKDEDEEDLESLIAARRGGDAPGQGATNSGAQQDDPRLRRMAESRGADRGRRRPIVAEVIEGDDDSEDEDEVARRRAKARARARAREEEEAVASGDTGQGAETAVEEQDGDDDEDIEVRRARARARAAQRQGETELAVESESEKEDESESGSSEYETATDSSEEEEEPLWGVRRLAKPVFVRASERESIIERDRQYEEEERREEEKIAAKEGLKIETRQKIASEIQKEQEGAEEAAEHDPMPDDDDEADEVALYEAWKIRELRRVMRDHEERRKAAQEKADIERRRKMTVRIAWPFSSLPLVRLVLLCPSWFAVSLLANLLTM